MCKKVLIATLAVAAGLLVVSFTKVGRHVKVWKADLCRSIEQQIPPEQEIARLKLELDNLSREDDRHFDKVARQIVEVKNLESQVARMGKEMTEREARIRAMKNSLAAAGNQITYKGEKVERDSLQSEYRSAGMAFQVDEETLKSKKEQLSLKKQILDDNRGKLSKLKLEREKMRTELVRLETALAQERQAQAVEKGTINDAGYERMSDELKKVHDRIEVLKQKRILKGEIESPIRVLEQKKDQEQAIDSYLNARFGDKQ